MKILVIDDEYLVRYTLARILRSEGYEVVTAADGQRGMAAFREAPPDIVITDIIMPEQDGIATIRQMRRERPEIKIIAISGEVITGNFDVLAISRKLGADDVIGKPFEAKALLACLRGLENLPPRRDGEVAA